MDVECRSFIAQYLFPIFLPQNTFLFRALEIGMEMYFITEGELEVLNVAESRTLMRLRKGSFVGEISLFPDLIAYRTSSVRATTDSHVFELRRHDLHENIRPHLPDVFEAIKEVASLRYRWLDAEPIKAAMRARCALRCETLHEEAKTYEEQRIAILKKQILENSMDDRDPDSVLELLQPVTQLKENEGVNFKAAIKMGVFLKTAADSEDAAGLIQRLHGDPSPANDEEAAKQPAEQSIEVEKREGAKADVNGEAGHTSSTKGTNFHVPAGPDSRVQPPAGGLCARVHARECAGKRVHIVVLYGFESIEVGD